MQYFLMCNKVCINIHTTYIQCISDGARFGSAFLTRWPKNDIAGVRFNVMWMGLMPLNNIMLEVDSFFRLMLKSTLGIHSRWYIGNRDVKVNVQGFFSLSSFEFETKTFFWIGDVNSVEVGGKVCITVMFGFLNTDRAMNDQWTLLGIGICFKNIQIGYL